MSAVPDSDLVAVETYFRDSGLPHLVADERTRGPRIGGRLRTAAAAAVVLVALLLPGLSWWQHALAAIAMAVVALGLLYLLVELGLFALFVHQGRPVLAGLRATTTVAIRQLPPLLAVLLFLSLATETWRAFGRLEGWRYGSVLIGFGILSLVILVAGLRRERGALYAPATGPDLARAARTTPAGALVDAGVVPDVPPLERRARVNVAAALLVSLAVRVLVVGLTVCGGFLVFGMLIVDRALTTEWVGQAPHVLLSLRLGGREVIVSEALVRVATTLGAFASLYFAAVALGDEKNREEFLDDEIDRVRTVMAAWAYYRGALRLTPTPGPPAGDG